VFLFFSWLRVLVIIFSKSELLSIIALGNEIARGDMPESKISEMSSDKVGIYNKKSPMF